MTEQFDHDGPRDDDADATTGWVDELGRRAGEAIRKPAPTDGLRALRTRQARRRGVLVAGSTAGAIVLVIAALVIVNRDDSTTSPPVDTGPAPTPSLSSASTPTATSATTSSVPAPTSVPVTTATVAPTTSQPSETTLPGIPPQLVFDQLPGGLLDNFGNPARTIQFLPDGKNLLVSPYGEATGNHLIIDGETGQVLRTLAAASGFFDKPISADGTRFFDGTTLWDLQTGTDVATVPTSGLGVFSPDSAWLAVIGFGAQNPQYQVFYAPTGDLVWSLPGQGNNAVMGEIWFDPDSSQVYLDGPSFDVLTGASLPAAPDRPSETDPKGFAADDALVSALAGPYKICGARSTFTIGGAGTRVDRCAISPDGSRIAMLVGDGNTIEIWTLEGTGR